MIRGEPPTSRTLSTPLSTSLEAGHADLLNACKSDQAQLLRELIEQKEAQLATTDVENLLDIAAQFGSADCLRCLLGCVRDGSLFAASEKYRQSDRFMAGKTYAQLYLDSSYIVDANDRLSTGR